MKLKEILESATVGATNAGNVGTVINPHISPGKARGKKSYTGSPGKSGTKLRRNLRFLNQKTKTAQLKTP